MWSFHIVEPFPIGIVADDDAAALQVTRLLLLRRLLSSPLLYGSVMPRLLNPTSDPLPQ